MPETITRPYPQDAIPLIGPELIIEQRQML
jgi:hypothetical protein